jgi:hypothetical protein
VRAAGSSWIAVSIVAMLASSAAAESDADVAFKRGRDLFKGGNYPEACVQFEKSQQLDPQLGTLFNLAQCHEKIGKLASARAAYREVLSKDTNADRRRFATDFEKKLAPRVPKLVVQIAGEPDGLTVRLGERLIIANTAIEMDNGVYALTVRATGMHDVTTRVKINEEGRTTTVVVPLTPMGSSEVAAATQSSEPSNGSGGSPRKTLGIAALAVGGATLATGGVFGWLAMSAWSDAKAVCDGMTCPTGADADRANDLRDKALSRATVSNVLFVAGGAIAVTGLILWLTAPSGAEQSDVAFSAAASGDGASVFVLGRF